MEVPSKVTETSLTALYSHTNIVEKVSLEPMEVRTFKLDYA